MGLYHRHEGERLTLRTVRDCGNRGPEAKDGSAFEGGQLGTIALENEEEIRAPYNS